MSLQPITVRLDVDQPQNINLGVQSGQSVNLDSSGVVNIGGDKHYVHTQSVASDTWTITHNLNKHPAVTVVDSAESVVVGDVQYLNDNSLQITFTGAFSGKAYLN